jgi:preprotein translocase subunit SecG
VGVLTAVFNTLIIIVSIFLICLILIQRGKGGGLAGAFGGVGGSSAFGTKAGDTFTKITVITATVWMLMAMLLVVTTGRRSTSGWGPDAPTSASKDLAPSSSRGKAKTSATDTAPASGSASSQPVEAPENAPAIPPGTSFPMTPTTPAKTP